MKGTQLSNKTVTTPELMHIDVYNINTSEVHTTVVVQVCPINGGFAFMILIVLAIAHRTSLMCTCTAAVFSFTCHWQKVELQLPCKHYGSSNSSGRSQSKWRLNRFASKNWLRKIATNKMENIMTSQCLADAGVFNLMDLCHFPNEANRIY